VEVVLDDTSNYYNGPESIGSVRFKQLPNDFTKSEDVTNKIAYPIDRANFVQPLAGEQVLCVLLFSEQGEARYYYLSTVSTEQTAAAVISPFLGTSFTTLKEAGYPTPQIAEKRFDDINGYTIDALKARVSQEKLREGDKVLEGKFGGVIKFTHTINKTGVWDSEDQITNLTKTTTDGDPMLIVKSALRSKKFEFEDDDINVDESSMYVTTTQTVPLVVSCARLKSFEVEPEAAILSALNDEDYASLQSLFGGGFDPNGVKIKPDKINLTGTPQIKVVPGALNPTGDEGASVGELGDITRGTLIESNPTGPWTISNGVNNNVTSAYQLRWHHNDETNPDPDPNQVYKSWSRTGGGGYVYDMVLYRNENGQVTKRPWIPSPITGTVSFAGLYSNKLDSAIHIKASNGAEYVMLHMDNFLVKVGSTVTRGQLIARQSDRMSSNYTSRNVHLHIQFPDKNVLINYIASLASNTW